MNKTINQRFGEQKGDVNIVKIRITKLKTIVPNLMLVYT